MAAALVAKLSLSILCNQVSPNIATCRSSGEHAHIGVVPRMSACVFREERPRMYFLVHVVITSRHHALSRETLAANV